MTWEELLESAEIRREIGIYAHWVILLKDKTYRLANTSDPNNLLGLLKTSGTNPKDVLKIIAMEPYEKATR